MSTIDVSEMQRDPLGWLARVQAGETVRIVAHDQAVAEIRPVPAPLLLPRPFGRAQGQFIVPDDFDSPLPDDVLRDFEGA